MTTVPSDSLGFLRRIDPVILLASIITLFLSLANEPWWTLTGTTRNLFAIMVSPFYVQISATGLPSTQPMANILGSLTRILVFLGFIAFFGASMKPTSWWRNLAVFFGLSSLAELYLSFTLMYYWAQTTLVSAYGIAPPFGGTRPLQANVIGLDLKFYGNPIVTATVTFPFYIGLLSLTMILGRSLMVDMRERALRALTALLPRGGVHDVYLTPPYQHVWFSSGDREFNPLSTDPETLNDDELLVSFQKLYQTVEPGGSLSIILPAWATGLADRFQRLMPDTGFTIETAGIVYRTPGKPENELRFRKPVVEAIKSPTANSTPEDTAQPLPTPPIALAEEAVDLPFPPVIESSEEPVWVHARMGRVERAILKFAVGALMRRQEPILYRELVNQVYMQLVDEKIDFDSARQIETSLLDHNGRELVLVEETDGETGRTVKKWCLGDQKLVSQKDHRFQFLRRIKLSRPKIRSRGSRTRPVLQDRSSEEQDEDQRSASGHGSE